MIIWVKLLSWDWRPEDIKLLEGCRTNGEFNYGMSKKYNSDEYTGEVWGSISIDETDYDKIAMEFVSKIYLTARYSEYSSQERDEADYLLFNGFQLFNDKYPEFEPEILAAMYDMSENCRTCYWGKRQIGNIKFRQKPDTKRLKLFFKHSFYSCEYFAEPNLYGQVFEPLGIASRQVFSHRYNKPFDNVVQLLLPIVLTEIELPHTKYWICPVCGRKYFSPFYVGPSIMNVYGQLPEIFLTRELFGHSDGIKMRYVVISQSLRQTLIKHKVIYRTHGAPIIRRHVDEFSK